RRPGTRHATTGPNPPHRRPEMLSPPCAFARQPQDRRRRRHRRRDRREAHRSRFRRAAGESRPHAGRAGGSARAGAPCRRSARRAAGGGGVRRGGDCRHRSGLLGRVTRQQPRRRWCDLEVREKRGVAYGISASLIWLNRAALLLGHTATRADATGQTIEIVEHEIRRLAEEGPTEDELTKAKTYLKGSFALGLDTSNRIASQLVQIQTDDLGIDYIERRAGLI